MSTRRVQSIIEQFNSSYGLPFQQLLPQETIEQFLAVEKIKYRQSRKDSRIPGKRTEPNDKLVTWYKPKYCPQGLCPKEYE